MRNKKTHSITIKRKLPKCSTFFFAFSELQNKYGEQLSKDENVLEFKANIKLEDFPLGDTYTTDFLITTIDGRTLIRECVYKSKLLKPMTIKLLDASREYWLSRGFTDWGIVVDE